MRVDKSQVMCILLGITLFAAGTIVEKQEQTLSEGNTIIRNSYGQGEKEEILLVKGLLEKEVPASLTIKERQYSSEEAELAFDPAYETLLSKLPGENESLDSVRRDVNLVTALEEYGMRVEWYSHQNELVDSFGRVSGGECPPQGQEAFLTATLRAGEYARDYVIRLLILPPEKTEEEKRLEDFGLLLKELDSGQSQTGQLVLPNDFKGAALSYSVKEYNDYWVFLLLGVAGALLIPLRKRQNEADKKKRRERQLLLDYSEIVSKLVVLLGAGMPVRGAWERVVYDYEKKARESGCHRYAYEEMKNTYYLMGRGASETRAYAEFGNRCRILPYRKLAGILEQNVKNGTAGLRPLLEAEMQDAFEQRKTLARRMGEEAGTKLLIPLFMMLAIVMVMIAMPAFLSFGI